jgi:hypothetical protein
MTLKPLILLLLAAPAAAQSVTVHAPSVHVTPPRVVVPAPPRVTVSSPGVYVAPPPRVVVVAPQPRPPRVVVVAPEPRPPRVVVVAPQPQPYVVVKVKGGKKWKHHGRGRGWGRGGRDD